MSKEVIRETLQRTDTPDIDSTDVDMAFDTPAGETAAEKRRAQQDRLNYLNGRDYTDDGLSVHDAETGKFKSLEEANSSSVEASVESPANMGILTLAQAAREARERGDRTALSDIEDEIENKLLEASDKYGWDNNTSMRRLDQINKIIHGETTIAAESEPADNVETGIASGAEVDHSALEGESAEEYEERMSVEKGDEPSESEDAEEGEEGPLQNESSDDEEGPLQNEKSGNVELPKDLQEKLDAARKEFIDAKIAVESSFTKKWFGGKKRAERLEGAKNSLRELEVEAARVALKPDIDKLRAEVAENGKDAEGTKSTAEELMAMHVFQQIKSIEQGAGEKYDKMLEERSGFRKFAAKVGRWFTKGGKVAKWLKGAGTGFVTGASTALVATWPVTVAVGAVTGLGVAGAAREAALEDHAGEKRVVDEHVDAWMSILRKSESRKDGEPRLDAMIDNALNRSVEDSSNRQDELKKKYRGAMGRYALGFALGSAVTSVSRGVVGALSGSEATPSTTSGGDASGTIEAGPSGDTTGTIEAEPSGDANGDTGSGDTIADQTPPAEVADYSDYDYPWNWAAEQFGADEAMSKLQELGQLASQDGYSVEWHSLGDGNPLNDWVSINGNSDTQAVLEILSQYAK